jgi:hypothetical protein
MKRWSLPHPVLLHWVLNPVLVFHEIVLGQRVPRLQLICNACVGPVGGRTFVPCPSCAVVHDSRLWSGGHAFGNWLGWVCPTCSKRIPCLWNVASLAVIAITAPLWYLPHLYYFRDRPTLRRFRARALFEPSTAWWRLGFAYGSLLWAITSLIPELLRLLAGEPVDYRRLIHAALVWYFAGLIFGFILRLATLRKNREKDSTWR